MEENRSYTMPLIGDKAPSFSAVTTQGPINFPEDYKGKWVILFSHPADFTPVCTTEFMTFATMADEFKALNTELVGPVGRLPLRPHRLAAQDPGPRVERHEGRRGQVPAHRGHQDGGRQQVRHDPALLLDHPGGARGLRSSTPRRSSAPSSYYPASTGRNFDEIKRIVVALQKADAEQVATPANWRPGQDVIIPTAGSCGVAKERMESQDEEKYCLDWFLCFRREKK